MKILTLIPARRDSKGIPGKNWKLLCNKPLIGYSIQTALAVSNKEDICISTNSPEIVELANFEYGLTVPFVRPEELSTDESPTRLTILHALEYYKNAKGIEYDAVLLLQTTSPFRKPKFVEECIELFQKETVEMVVSVNESELNPYYNLYSEDENGYIKRAINSNYTRRQECPPVYLINGSIYVIDAKSIKSKEIHEFEKVIKYIMPSEFKVDLDSPKDWALAEFMFNYFNLGK